MYTRHVQKIRVPGKCSHKKLITFTRCKLSPPLPGSKQDSERFRTNKMLSECSNLTRETCPYDLPRSLLTVVRTKITRKRAASKEFSQRHELDAARLFPTRLLLGEIKHSAPKTKRQSSQWPPSHISSPSTNGFKSIISAKQRIIGFVFFFSVFLEHRIRESFRSNFCLGRDRQLKENT